MRRRNLLPLTACVLLLYIDASAARSQDLDLPIPPGPEVLSPDGFIPEGTGIPENGAEVIHEGFPIGAPMSMIDTPPTPVPYPGVELWEGFCNHHDGLTEACCDCAPLAWGAIDVLWLRRNEPVNEILVEDDDDEPELQSSDFDFDFEPGVRITVGRVVCCTPVEISYFGTHDWRSTILAEDDDDLYVPIQLFRNGAFTEADVVDAAYSSDLHSIELNILHSDCCRDVTVIAGVRYISFDEQFDLLAIDSDDGIGVVEIGTINKLVGLQAGGVFERTCGCWTFGAIAKAGVFANFSESDFIIYEEDRDGERDDDLRVIQDEDDVSFVGEAIVGASYCLGAGFSLRAGYQLTWINGVTLAPEQFGDGNYHVPFTPPTIDGEGEVLFDGGYLGLAWTR